jgi:hypothetical protein
MPPLFKNLWRSLLELAADEGGGFLSTRRKSRLLAGPAWKRPVKTGEVATRHAKDR